VPQDHPLRPIRQMVDVVLKELSPQFQPLLSVQDGFLWTQVDAQLLGHRHDFIDVGDRVHRFLSFSLKGSQNASDDLPV
jgi:hypothetical protein